MLTGVGFTLEAATAKAIAVPIYFLLLIVRIISIEELSRQRRIFFSLFPIYS
jgi:hypothetical protein